MNKKVMVCASDTFRAAAVDQLTIWSQRIGVEIVKHKMGSDPAAVAYDACEAAKARNFDILIVDTAGRLHTQDHLMHGLTKIRDVVAKRIPGAPHEVLLVLDATTGQNAIQQAKHFSAAIGVTGIVLAKLDGTAKGGVVVSIHDQLSIPVKFIGLGETPEDIETFDPQRFVTAACLGKKAARGRRGGVDFTVQLQPMRRFRRWLFNALAAISLTLCLAVGVIWAAGVHHDSGVIHLWSGWRSLCGIGRRGGNGSLGLALYHYRETEIVGPVIGPGRVDTPEIKAWKKTFGSRAAFEHWGFEVGWQPSIGTAQSNHLVMRGDARWIVIPDWLAMLALAILPVMAWKGRHHERDRRRREQGLCVVCGYDLRATPQRCPECGAIPTHA